MTDRSHADKEGFGEASLGEGQSENPELDPAMLMYEQERDAEENADKGDDGTPDVLASPEDEDSGPAATAEHTYEQRHLRDSEIPEE